MAKKFVPKNYQVDFPFEQHLVHNPKLGEDAVPLDVLFVGAGPAGLCGAIKLAQMIKADPNREDIEIGVLEKAESLGGHSLSGAVINPKALHELFPHLSADDFPFHQKVEKESVLFMTEKFSIPVPTPPTMNNHGNYTASLSEVVRWLGEKAEDLGIHVLTSFAADKLLVNDKDQVMGVRTTAMGLMKDGSEGSDFTPPTDITAKVTVLTEGTRGHLSQTYNSWKKIHSKIPQIYALGVKEVWKVKKPLDKIIHTLGYPLPSNVFGGTWMYPLGPDKISIGLVVGLDAKNPDVDAHALLQKLKKHPLFKKHLEGGSLLEWGAKTIPEGGLLAFPEHLSGDGILFAGDCVGMVNVPALKGIHYAMKSGILAAECLFDTLAQTEEVPTHQQLQTYDTKVKNSYIYSDLKEVQYMRHAFQKGGLYLGGLKAALMTATKGAFPKLSLKSMNHEDADAKRSTHFEPIEQLKLSKVDAVYQSGNKTRDDIPTHLVLGKDIPEDVAKFYAAICPAGVYEVQDGKLIVNAPNCVDCKATDVIGPRWTPREGGSGPQYRIM